MKPAVVAPSEPVVSQGSASKEEKSDKPASPVVPSTVGASMGKPVIENAAAEAKKWAKRAEEAVAKATSTGSPESWQEASRLSAVVSEMTQTLQAAAEAEHSAAQLVKAAEEATLRAQAAVKKSEEAEKAVVQSEQAAREADEAAKLARRTATDAKVTAERAAQVVPTLIEAENRAAAAAAAAEKKAASLTEIVKTASEADTAVAWTEALKKSSATTN